MEPRYDFANILFGGPCNRSCYFCIGRQMPAVVQQSNLNLFPPRNIDGFIAAVQEHEIHQIVFTGTTTDPQMYRYEAELLSFLRERINGAQYSLHTNGVLALKKLDVFNAYDRVCISFPSFVSGTYQKMMGSPHVPDLAAIMKASRVPVKISCLVTEENASEIPEFLERCRMLSIRRVVLRKLYGDKSGGKLLPHLTPARFYRDNPVYDLDGMEVTCWDFDLSSSTSINLFADGTLGTSYLIVQTPELARNEK
ncbi:MAG TPA: radical SAM protein [Planctomycetota bacterium]|nr:radical SAM protein [Planctomycetota bacterium]